jgi:hypothetical protein
MPTAPGGQIIGGMGGRIWAATMGYTADDFANLFTPAPDDVPGSLDVAQWRVNRQFIYSECPHTGTWGAISRRLVGYDWHFAASIPVDQSQMPDWFLQTGFPGESDAINLCIAFYLGNVEENPEAAAMEMDQKYYYSPAMVLLSANPVLNAVGDVIRMEVMGAGNGRLYLIPDEITAANAYTNYLQSRGWWT